ncbi:l1 transposable element-related [Holotrichia oblita]|uniref:L1 transposable element-related n=1 Tax=Holotrichia oblita TaxID=644536 RepID=A0ACB9TIC8_HOLOL|nr:l1 transposable element-related [Holotrichia oblita]
MPVEPRTTRSTAENEAFIKKVVEKVLTSYTLMNELIAKIRTEIISEHKEEIKILNTKVEQLEQVLKSAKDEAKKASLDLEQYSRRNSIRIFGVPERDNEDTNEVVIDLCKNKLNLDIPSDKIDCSHRRRAKESNHRPILVKFISRDKKKSVYNNKKKLKGTKIVIKEDLTASNNQLLKEAVKKYGGKSAWSNDGKIFIKVHNKIKLIKNLSDLA